uniref:Uncharacterized protein n=1 Tax=Arundo donax TaxID=35708 RepID=A0A0A9U4J8_ARUDO
MQVNQTPSKCTTLARFVLASLDPSQASPEPSNQTHPKCIHSRFYQDIIVTK